MLDEGHENIFSERNSSFFVLWTLYIQDGQFVLLSSKTNRQFQIYSDRWDPAIFEGRLGNQTRIDKLLSLSTLFRPDTHFRRHMQTVQTLIRCRKTRRLIRVNTVCLQEFYATYSKSITLYKKPLKVQMDSSK